MTAIPPELQPPTPTQPPAPTAPVRMKGLEKTRSRTAVLMLIPMLLVLAAVAGYPLLRTIYLSFTDYNFLNDPAPSGSVCKTTGSPPKRAWAWACCKPPSGGSRSGTLSSSRC
ncbi:hypothetical protein MSS93_00435 [Deinococcus radiodurans]|nr:hypothetical protein MSS93_00435 [Deinococcus radiodurans]